MRRRHLRRYAYLRDICLAGMDAVHEPGRDQQVETACFFESRLPHCWQNLSAEPSKKILILCPSVDYDQPIGRHFTPD